MERSNFHVAMRSVFEVCPPALRGQLDLTDATALARFDLEPTEPSPGVTTLAQGIFADGSVLVGTAAGPNCFVQFRGTGYDRVSGAIADALAKRWTRRSDEQVGGSRFETFVQPSGQRGVLLRMVLLTNPATNSVMAYSDYLKGQ